MRFYMYILTTKYLSILTYFTSSSSIVYTALAVQVLVQNTKYTAALIYIENLWVIYIFALHYITTTVFPPSFSPILLKEIVYPGVCSLLCPLPECPFAMY